MSNCPKCGFANPPDTKFCAGCGQTQVTARPKASPAQPKKKIWLWVVLGLAGFSVLGVILVVGVVGFFVFQIQSKPAKKIDIDIKQTNVSTNTNPTNSANTTPATSSGKAKIARVNGSQAFLLRKIITLPEPIYPPAAKAVKASGEVVVKVTIDQDGMPGEVEATSGHPLLRAAAQSAIRASRFSPSTSSDTGTITFRFDL